MPSKSATKVGAEAVVEDNAAVLEVGLVVMAHKYVSVSPLASVLPVPLSVTVITAGEPVRVTVWLVPALATGVELAAEAVTVTADTLELFTLPSFTIKLIT